MTLFSTRPHRTHVPRVVLGLVATAALGVSGLTACSKKSTTDADQSSSATSTTAAPSDTTSATMAPGTTAATTSTSSTMVRPPVPMTITRSTDGTSPDGSGCTPPAGDTLPDGMWFGFTKGVDTGAPSLTLDLACFYTGAAATKAAGRTPDDPVENDYFITNQNPKLYTLQLAGDVDLLRLADNGASSEFEPVQAGPAAVADASAALGDNFLSWIAVSNGRVVVVQQQFVP